MIVSKSFEEDAEASAVAFGMPDLPFVVVPQTLTNHTEAEIVAMADGVVDEICKLLVSSEESSNQFLSEAAPEVLQYAGTDYETTVDAFQEDFLSRGWGDGFPLVQPTEARVREMLKGTSHKPDEVVCVLEPGNTLATVEKIAVNAVMAGCKPAYLPVVLAAVEAMSDPKFELRIVACSTGMHAPCTIVNGPIVKKLGINSGRAALGPGVQSRANIAIGRAVRLVLMNVGHAYVGSLDQDTIGTPNKFSMCMAENEEANPWMPLHVEHGFKPADSTVTMFGVTTQLECIDMGNTGGKELLKTYAGSVTVAGWDGLTATYRTLPLHWGHIMLVFAPDHARLLHAAGMSKADIRRYMFENARREWKWMGNLLAGDLENLRPEWEEFAKDPEKPTPPVRGEDYFHMCVVGATAGKSQIHLGAGVPITRSIDKWM